MVISWVLNGQIPIIHGDVNENIMNMIYKWWIFHCDVCLPQGKHFHLGEGSWNGWFDAAVAGDRNSDSEIPQVASWEPELESHPKQIFYHFLSSHAQPKICILLGGFKHDWIIFHFIYGNVIIPTDEVIFFRGVGQPPNRISFLRWIEGQLRWSWKSQGQRDGWWVPLASRVVRHNHLQWLYIYIYTYKIWYV